MSEHPPQAPPAARPFPIFAYAMTIIVALAAGAAGLGLMYWRPVSPELGTVKDVRITIKPGIDVPKVRELFSTPDYYLELVTSQGSERTKVRKNTPVGSGITFALPVPVRLADINEIKIWDSRMLGDTMVDRIDRMGREVDGEKFRFSLIGWTPPPTRDRQIGLWLTIVAAGVLAIVLLRVVWQIVL